MRLVAGRGISLQADDEDDLGEILRFQAIALAGDQLVVGLARSTARLEHEFVVDVPHLLGRVVDCLPMPGTELLLHFSVLE